MPARDNVFVVVVVDAVFVAVATAVAVAVVVVVACLIPSGGGSASRYCDSTTPGVLVFTICKCLPFLYPFPYPSIPFVYVFCMLGYDTDKTTVEYSRGFQ